MEAEASRGSRVGQKARCSTTLTYAHSIYKTAISPFLHSVGITGSCRFQPTCSEYATLALAQHGPGRGLWLSLARLLRCHPFARGGWDPVPPHAGCSQGSSLPGGMEARLESKAGTIEMPHSTNDPA